MIHQEPSEFAGKTVVLADGETRYQVEDWWDRVSGDSWMSATGNMACIQYAMRSASAGIPLDNEVVYGKVGAFGHLVHVSEIKEVVEQ